MKEYNAHFSCYSELYGNFDEIIIKVEAENQFDARRKAWEASDKSGDLEFSSCVKLCGITWKASPLDMQDYFNAQAEYDKCEINCIENIKKPNARIEQNEKKLEECERERYGNFGSLHTITRIAEDFGKPLGMLPPAIYEELHYAKEFCYQLDYNDYDKSSALLKIIEQAEKWDRNAMHSIQQLFRYGSGLFYGQELDFYAQFAKNGVYPVYADRTDYESQYIQRWTSAREYKSMVELPFFGEKDIIAGSQSMQYEWQTLVLNKEALQPENQIPYNLLWITKQENTVGYDTNDKDLIIAENLITGEIAEWKRSDFIGVLRPEKDAKINYEEIKAEYQALQAFNEKIIDKMEKPEYPAAKRKQTLEEKLQAANEKVKAQEIKNKNLKSRNKPEELE